jgi:hypothetical protein
VDACLSILLCILVLHAQVTAMLWYLSSNHLKPACLAMLDVQPCMCMLIKPLTCVTRRCEQCPRLQIQEGPVPQQVGYEL